MIENLDSIFNFSKCCNIPYFRYDGARITKNGIRDTDCGIKISDVKVENILIATHAVPQ
jgi:hypothetical protein